MLKRNRSVRVLDLHGIHVDALGAEALASTLGKYNRTVTSVKMRHCGIGPKGGIHMAKLLIGSDSAVVGHVDLSVNDIGNEALLSLKQAM
jgi:hypothetical protein